MKAADRPSTKRANRKSKVPTSTAVPQQHQSAPSAEDPGQVQLETVLGQDAGTSLSAVLNQLQPAQGRAAVSRMGRLQGNRYVQRVIGSAQPPRVLDIRSQRSVGLGAMVQRADEAADTTEATALAPKGPLSKLKSELDDAWVSESKCLTYLGQLGTGERQLVRKDATMMGQMAKEFDAGEMFRAVELLDFELKWAIYWLNKAGEADSISSSQYAQLIGSASAQEIAEMIGWATVRQVVQANYEGNPLTFAPLALDNAKMVHVIKTYRAFSDWVISRAGASLYLRYIAANDPAAMLGALKAAHKLYRLLIALNKGKYLPVPDRAALLELFKVSTDANDRRRMFEIRFGLRYSGEFDWLGKGEEQWATQEKMLGEKSESQIKADIAAGKGPKNVKEAIKADKKGPLAKLKKELSRWRFLLKPRLCMQYLRELNATERYLVREDASMMARIAKVFDASQIAQTLSLLRFSKIGNAIKWIQQSNTEGGLSSKDYQLLVNDATSQQVAELVGWRDMFDVFKSNARMDPLSIMPLVNDDPKMAHVIKTYPYFSDWVLDDSGAQAYVRYIAGHSPTQTAAALKTAGKLNTLVDKLPSSMGLTPHDQKAMFTVFDKLTALGDKKLLMKKRFNLEAIVKQDPTKPEWDAAGLKMVWQLLERLPPSQVAGNEWLKRLTRTGSAGPSGVTGGDRVGINYDPTKLGELEAGGFADPTDVMFGTKVLDAVVIHEMGHAADNQYNFSDLSGPLGTRADLGKWRQYTDMSAFYDVLYTATNVAGLGLSLMEKAALKIAVVRALDRRYANPETAFKDKAGVGNWSAGKSWYDLWQKVKAHAIIKALVEGHKDKSPWDTPPAAIGTRYYHEAYPKRWASYLTASRAGGKLSRYQFRNHREFFAEMYATYYLTPADPGKLIKNWNAGAYRWFRETVDQGYSTKAK